MKIYQLTWPLALVMAGGVACEEKAQTEAAEVAAEAAKAGTDKAADAVAGKASEAAGAVGAAASTPPPPPPPPPMPSPAEVCGNVVAAIKAHDDAKLGMLATPASMTALATKEAKEHVGKALSEGTCGMAKVEEDKATVTVTTAGQPMDVAFVKLADGWKFDAVTFLEKNPAKSPHAAKKGKETHGKGKGHPKK